MLVEIAILTLHMLMQRAPRLALAMFCVGGGAATVSKGGKFSHGKNLSSDFLASHSLDSPAAVNIEPVLLQKCGTS